MKKNYNKLKTKNYIQTNNHNWGTH